MTSTRRGYGLGSLLLGVSFGILSGLPAAQAAQLVDRTSLNANDQVVWSSLGQVFNPFLPGPPGPPPFLGLTVAATSQQGRSLTVSLPAPQPGVSPPFVFRNALPPQGIPANFTNGDFVFFTGLQLGAPVPTPGNPGPLTLTFAQPVFGAGAQFAVDDTPSFTAFIEAYDSVGQRLGQFSQPGTASTNPDGSAIFLGIRSDQANISQIRFFSSAPTQAIGIGTLSLATASAPGVASGLLISLSLGFVPFRRKNQT